MSDPSPPAPGSPVAASGPAAFLLIESQPPSAAPDTGFGNDAMLQARQGHRVVMLLIQDAVELALPGRSAELDGLLAAGGRLWVDGFSLTQRGLPGSALRPEAETVDMDVVADSVLDPATKVVWH